jgi:prepilin-type N-terminal cleavage/methylation domain-containing protein
MARLFFDHWQPFRLFSRRKKAAGFTLLELLVALAVGSIVTVGLLTFLVQLLQANQRDAARSDTQRDLQAAIDYIARDLREAVYVYSGQCLATPNPYTPSTDCPGLRNYLPPEIAGTATTAANLPVLAFWRVDPLPEPLMTRCVSNAGAFSGNGVAAVAAIQGVPCLSRRMYTLVVYSLNWEQRDSVRGRARITRYQLPQYSYRRGSAVDTPPVTTPGWVDPVGRDTDFVMWPVNKALAATGSIQSLQATAPQANWGANHLVLVDYVDRQGIYDGGAPVCPVTPNSTTAGTTTAAGELYQLTPGLGQTTHRGFYICVKGATDQGALNQEVILRIQGEAANRPGIPDFNPTRPLISVPMEMRVMTRGVLNKTQ